MEPLKDAVSVRLSRLNNLVLNKHKEKSPILNRDGLFDALQVLYDECNNESTRNSDKNVSNFVDRYRKNVLELKKLRVNITDFDVRNVIGRGHFGEVHVVKERQTNDVYAMKTVRKYDSSEHKCATFTEERNIMASANSPWITKLQYAFQDTNNLYFIMEYHPGGDLLGLLYRQGGTIPETAATFYLAELVLAINDVHAMGYIHRDIKPDNVLMDRCGHLKLADFGSAAKLNANGFVAVGSIPAGTPDYIAPEALQSLDNKTSKNNGRYGKACDYWSLGILAYELVIGSTPFTGQNTSATYSKIMNHTKTLKFPPDLLLTQAYIHLIKCLLTDQSSRIGHDKIIKHTLFKNIDFNKIRDQVPPFVPKIASLEDTSNFNSVQKKKKDPHIDNFKAKTQFTGRNLPFIGFTYTTEPNELDEQLRSSILVKDDQAEKLRREIDELHKKLSKAESSSQDKDILDKKLEEKSRKLESIECVRDKLERDLANNIAECQALKRTLDLERKDRSELERKALELIKAAKFKWEAAEKVKLANLNQELLEYRERCDTLSNEVDQLKIQLQRAIDKTIKHKTSMENVEKLRRSSVVGLESRLEKVTVETQSRISILQAQVIDEMNKKSSIAKTLSELETSHAELKNQFELSEKQNRELKSKCKESDSVIDMLKKDVARLEVTSEDLEFHKALIHSLEEDIEELKANNTAENDLKKEIDANNVLKKQIKDLKGELNGIRSSKLSTIDELHAKHKTELKKYEDELKAIKNEKSDCEIKLQEANLNLKSKEEKAETLEGLLAQLQKDLSKLETGSEREGVLQEQIERLEQQVVEVSGAAALDKQELTTLKSKFWRLEKDITNADLDMKIIQRDLKDEKKQNADLCKKIKALEDQIEATKKTSDNAVAELGTLNENLSVEIEKLKVEIQTLQNNIVQLTIKEELSSKDKDHLKQQLEGKELKICSLLEVVDSLKCEKLVVEQKLKDAIDEKNRSSSQSSFKDREINNLKSELNKYKADLETSLLNRSALREACTLLENQLVEFETILDCSESKRKEMETEIEHLQNTATQYKSDVQEARKQYNEEKSMRLLAETKVKRLLDDVAHQEKEIESFKADNEEFKIYSNDLSEELKQLDGKLVEQDLTIKSYERQIEDYVSENNYLKEENSEQLTFINSVKESNYSLSHRLSDSQHSIKALVEKITDLDALLNEKTQYIVERELKADSTIQQQTKLIDYLQSKVEESSKKKKTLSDKIFGSSKKENVPPLHSVALNYKDLEVQLAKEREQNKSLHQEIIKLKAEMYKQNESEIKVDALKNLAIQDEILAQIVHSPASQKNDIYRQNSIQRMHHNIPHRFDSKLCTKPLKCAHCSNQILLGRHMNVCRECHVTTHTNCAISLPRTCGLPTEYAMHYSNSLNKMHSGSSSTIDSAPQSNESINIEGWVKIPCPPVGWEKHYACLTATTLNIYAEPPNMSGAKPEQSINLHRSREHGKIVLEPVPSEIPVPVANSDLPFVIKVETSPNTTCWPSQSIIFMTLSIEDKERWQAALQNLFKAEKTGDVLLFDTEDMDINCLVELNKDIKLLGTETGLYALQKNKCIKILGPSCLAEIVVIPSINAVIMIAEANRCLITCDLKHLTTLCDASPCGKPTLKYHPVNVNKMDGFHILKASDFQKNKVICTATSKKVAILKYDLNKNDFFTQRILDTAQPTSCILFTEHSLLIGADKFFEVDLTSYEADEFLDASDTKLLHAVNCYQMQSFPLSIQCISKPPNAIEYLVCFHEFATFVDEYGRSTRKNDIYWTTMPKAFYYAKKYLYVLQFNTLEIYKFTENTCNGTQEETLQLVKIDLPNSQYLGENCNGVYVLSSRQIKYIDAHQFDDSLSVTTDATSIADDGAESDRFSFTSSVMHCLDDNVSEDDTDAVHTNRRVKFTDL